MIKISEITEYAIKYTGTLKPKGIFERGDQGAIADFIKFIEKEQKKNKKTSVTPLELREGMRRLKELKERQAENKRLTPETDFNEIL